jgi:hypothetical protein
MPWLKRLVTGLAPWSSGFAPGSVHVVDKVALGMFFIKFFSFPPASHHSTMATYLPITVAWGV